jgi:quinol monooxygenase YgiN
MDRRTFVKELTTVMMVTPVFARSQEAGNMWGVITKITIIPGKRDEMIAILKESTAEMPGCLTYIVAKDCADENATWVNEVWDSQTSHDASLSLPSVKNAMPRAKPIISKFEKIAVTNPMWGVGLTATHDH